MLPVNELAVVQERWYSLQEAKQSSEDKAMGSNLSSHSISSSAVQIPMSYLFFFLTDDLVECWRESGLLMHFVYLLLEGHKNPVSNTDKTTCAIDSESYQGCISKMYFHPTATCHLACTVTADARTSSINSSSDQKRMRVELWEQNGFNGKPIKKLPCEK